MAFPTLVVTPGTGTTINTLPNAGQDVAANCLPVVLPVLQDPTRAEDSASADGDRGIGLLAIRKATPANTSGTDGDYEFLQVSGGLLWTTARTDQTTHGTTDLVAADITKVAGSAIAQGHGAAAAAIRVELPTDGTGVIATVGAVTAITNALPAGTNAIGSVTQPDPAATTGSITAADAASTTVTNSLGQSVVTGTATANSAAAVTLSGHSLDRIQLKTTDFNGTVVFERSIDGGTTWLGVSVTAPGVVGNQASAAFTGAASTLILDTNVAGTTQFRVRCTARSAGTLSVTHQPGYGVKDVAVPGGTQPTAGVSGGATPYRLKSAASNNASSVKASAGQIYSIRVVNLDTVNPVYVRLYNKASAPAPATDNALIVDEIYVPAAASASQGSVVTWSGPAVGGGGFANGIGLATVTGVADTDNTAVAANSVLVMLWYK